MVYSVIGDSQFEKQQGQKIVMSNEKLIMQYVDCAGLSHFSATDSLLSMLDNVTAYVDEVLVRRALSVYYVIPVLIL